MQKLLLKSCFFLSKCECMCVYAKMCSCVCIYVYVCVCEFLCACSLSLSLALPACLTPSPISTPPPPLSTVPPPSQPQEREASAILQDIAKARQNIQKSLAGVSTVTFIVRQKKKNP